MQPTLGNSRKSEKNNTRYFKVTGHMAYKVSMHATLYISMHVLHRSLDLRQFLLYCQKKRYHKDSIVFYKVT